MARKEKPPQNWVTILEGPVWRNHHGALDFQASFDNRQGIWRSSRAPQDKDPVLVLILDSTEWVLRRGEIHEPWRTQRDEMLGRVHVAENAQAKACDLQALWSSLSETEQNRIKLCRSEEYIRIQPLSLHGAEVVEDGIEFPLGVALRLLNSHFGEAAGVALRALALPDELRGLKRWQAALAQLRDALNENVMRPAFWASQAAGRWNWLQAHVSAEDGMTFDAPVLSIEDKNVPPVVVDFDAAKAVVEAWKVTMEGQHIQSRALMELVDMAVNARPERKREHSHIRFPEFPGGAFNEFL